MSKLVSDKTAIFLTDGTLPTGVDVVSISNTTPAVVSVASGALTTMELADGDQVLVQGTGEPRLDDKFFAVSAVGDTADSFTLNDTDLVDLAAPITVGTVAPYNMSGSSPEFFKACESSVTLNGQEPDNVDLSDMCESEKKLGDAKPPTVSFTGFVNSEDEGFKNIIRASLESPKTPRVLSIVYPDGEYVTGPAEIGAISVAAARGQGLTYSGTATYVKVPTYSWAL